jgi:CRISPR-associated protein Csm4
MRTYRLKLKPKSSFITPWQADTIFGSLCWIMAWRKGAESLTQFLSEYRKGNPCFILSDGMPGDLLPAPVYLPLILKTDDYQKAKSLKKTAWLRPDEFEMLRKGNFELEGHESIKPFKTFTTLHSSINRLTGTTGDEGSLFELEEYVFDFKAAKADYISVYLKIREGFEDMVMSLFRDLALSGYGAKKSAGKGSFEIMGELVEFKNFDAFKEANAFVTLSNFVPAPDDPADGYYRTMVKYGKLGGEYTFTDNPFKRPIVMITTGSTFLVKETYKPYYGCMIINIAPSRPEIIHYGYAFAVPVSLRLNALEIVNTC